MSQSQRGAREVQQEQSRCQHSWLGPSVTKARSHPTAQPCPGTCGTLRAEPPQPNTSDSFRMGRRAAGCGHLQPSCPNELCSPLHRGTDGIPSQGLSFLPQQW